jgi:hypothetical protein
VSDITECTECVCVHTDGKRNLGECGLGHIAYTRVNTTTNSVPGGCALDTRSETLTKRPRHRMSRFTCGLSQGHQGALYHGPRYRICRSLWIVR